MNHDDQDDPDSGHPTPRDLFDPAEAITSTPIPTPRRQGLRPTSFISEPFSPVVSSRFRNSHSNDYNLVNGVIDIFKRNKRLEEDVEEMKNQSMMSEHELEEKEAKIAELEDELTRARTVTVNAEIDLREVKQIKQEDASVGCTLMEEKWRNEEEKWKEEMREMEETKRQWEDERRRIEDEKMEVERRWDDERKWRDEEKERMEEEIREIKDQLREEKKKVDELSGLQIKFEMVETEKELIKKKALNIESMLREKEERMDEEWKRKERMVEEMESNLESKENELVEERRRGREKEVEIERLNGVIDEIEGMREKKEEIEREAEALKERISELEKALSAVNSESALIRSLERKMEEAERKITVAEQALSDAADRYENLERVRKEEMAEALGVKDKFHELRAEVDGLRRANEGLEEKRREGERMREELERRMEEKKRMDDEMTDLKKELERRRNEQKKLEDELEIARRITEDSNRSMIRMKEEAEKRGEEGRMEWMDKELRDSEEVKRKIEKEKEDVERLYTEAIDAVNEYRRIYENTKAQFEEFQISAQHQYDADMEEKNEELMAVRERLAQFENYPGKLVSVDGRYSDGKSVYDLLPAQLKDLLASSTDESVQRGVACCKSMIIRGPINRGEEERREEEQEEDTEAPPPPPLPLDQLQMIVERLNGIPVASSQLKFLVDCIVTVFEKLKNQGITDATVSEVCAHLVDELSDLDGQIEETEKRSEENGEKLRMSEEERRGLIEEIGRADEERKKTMAEMNQLHGKLVKLREERNEAKHKAREFENAAHEFWELKQDDDAEIERLKKEVEECRQEMDLQAETHERREGDLHEKKRRIQMQQAQIDELEAKLEHHIYQMSEQSRKAVSDGHEITRLEKEVKRMEKMVKHERTQRDKKDDFVLMIMDAIRNHYSAYCKVKSRNEQRQKLLDQCVRDIEDTRKMMGGNERLERLQQTIESEVTQMKAGDALDYKSCEAMMKKIQEMEEEPDKENYSMTSSNMSYR